MTQRIFVLYTGGTIGMTQGENGLQPNPKLADTALAHFSDGIQFTWHICQPLIDSSALTLQNWYDWLHILRDKIPEYDGILILHGTDTMAYTANLLALALNNLNKPIIITGSQLPYDSPNSDAPYNLATAISAFALAQNQVLLAFNGKVFPAIGSKKVSTETAEGFANPHFGALNQWQESTGWQHTLMPSEKNNAPFSIAPFNPQAQVAAYTLAPGFSLQNLADGIRTTSAQAIILQTYGHGNAPSDDYFIQTVQQFTQKGGIILNISQVEQGCAAAVYAQGSALRQSGAISGGKCNLETATALLTLAVSAQHRADWVEQQLAHCRLV